MKHILKSLLSTTLLAFPAVLGADADLPTVEPANTESVEMYNFANHAEAQATTDRLFANRDFTGYIEACKKTARLCRSLGNGWMTGVTSDPYLRFSDSEEELRARALGIGLLELEMVFDTPFVKVRENIQGVITLAKYTLLVNNSEVQLSESWFTEDEGGSRWFSPEGIEGINAAMTDDQMLQELWNKAQSERQTFAAQ